MVLLEQVWNISTPLKAWLTFSLVYSFYIYIAFLQSTDRNFKLKNAWMAKFNSYL